MMFQHAVCSIKSRYSGPGNRCQRRWRVRSTPLNLFTNRFFQKAVEQLVAKHTTTRDSIHDLPCRLHHQSNTGICIKHMSLFKHLYEELSSGIRPSRCLPLSLTNQTIWRTSARHSYSVLRGRSTNSLSRDHKYALACILNSTGLWSGHWARYLWRSLCRILSLSMLYQHHPATERNM